MTFRDLHQPGNPFILANAWDVGSAKLLAGLGASAIATSSSAQAFTLGRGDRGTLSRDEALAHASDLVSAVGVPVSGDFENGFGHDPDTCAETVRLAAEAGLAGISIEDIANPEVRAYDRDLAVERIRAAAAAARALPRDFVLVARADGVMENVYDMDEAIARITAFDAAGADCLYVPAPPDRDALTRVVAATKKPVNALAAGSWAATSQAEFANLGIARISIGGALGRVTQAVIRDLGRAMIEDGDFSGLAAGASEDEILAIFDRAG